MSSDTKKLRKKSCIFGCFIHENINDDLKKDCRSGLKRKSPPLVPQNFASCQQQIRSLKKEVLKDCFYEIQNLTVNTLKHNTNTHNLKTNIKMLADIMLIVFPFNCENHKEKLQSFFLDTTINVIVYSWCRSVNIILSGKITYDEDDELKKAAQIYYNKHCKHKK